MSASDKKKQQEELEQVFSTFVSASHILHYHGVVDAYGHISVRNPLNPSTFFMSQNLAPALISSRDDLIEYKIEDASPVDPNARPGYSERCIHSEVLKKYPGVNSVVHSHCADVLPYCISNVPLKPTIHMSGFLGTDVPVWDISPSYQHSDRHDLLVRNTRLGAALASAFTKSQAMYARVGATLTSKLTGSQPAPPHAPDHTVVLMRGHGFTTAAPSIEQAVYQSVYTQAAAKAQTSATLLNSAYADGKLEGRVDDGGVIKGAAVKPAGGLLYLSERETEDAWAMNRFTVGRPWGLWVREVETSPLYVNECKRAA